MDSRPFLLLLLLLVLVDGKPSPRMCSSFLSYVSKWHSDKSTLVGWVTLNCDKIQPKPAGMSCRDVVQFATDCSFDGLQTPSERYQQSLAAVQPVTLQRYLPYNQQTVQDYGAFGNWYYPNYTPWTYISGGYDGRRNSRLQLENDLKMTRGSNYPYNRADNLVNIALQQTMVPTCLHDAIYCAKLAIAQKEAGEYGRYYNMRREWQRASVREAELPRIPSRPTPKGGSEWWKEWNA